MWGATSCVTRLRRHDAKITNAAAPSAQTAALGQGLTLFVPPGEWDRLDVEQVTGAGFRLGP
jgi:hypothetical protein